ncbi:MAG TPA: hypothetical protein DCW94_01360 [Porticoccaceae bacterium]|jgi:FixJ family two-component response regulator|nr:hypothetical protein [Porticoccaceae bacterium]
MEHTVKVSNLSRDEPNLYIDLVASDMTTHDTVMGYLSELNLETTVYNSGSSLITDNKLHKTNCLIIETELDDMLGITLFKKLLVIYNSLPPTIFIGVQRGCTAEAVEAMGLGAIDYIEKPFSLRRLMISLKLALETTY